MCLVDERMTKKSREKGQKKHKSSKSEEKKKGGSKEKQEENSQNSPAGGDEQSPTSKGEKSSRRRNSSSGKKKKDKSKKKEAKEKKMSPIVPSSVVVAKNWGDPPSESEPTPTRDEPPVTADLIVNKNTPIFDDDQQPSTSVNGESEGKNGDAPTSNPRRKVIESSSGVTSLVAYDTVSSDEDEAGSNKNKPSTKNREVKV